MICGRDGCVRQLVKSVFLATDSSAVTASTFTRMTRLLLPDWQPTTSDMDENRDENIIQHHRMKIRRNAGLVVWNPVRIDPTFPWVIVASSEPRAHKRELPRRNCH